jgi:hypothetical protein
MSKSAKKRSTAKSKSSVAPVKRSKRTVGNAKLENANPGSKQSRVIAMLQSPAGATVAAMMKTTGWQPHSVRGFLASVVRKRLKLGLESKKVDGERVYQIASAGAGKSIKVRQPNNSAA